MSNIGSALDKRQDLATSIIAFIGECNKRGANEKPIEPGGGYGDVRNTLDRDKEANQVNEFLSNQRQQLLEVSGLPQIGKSSALERALTLSAVQKILRIPLTSSSSPDYILYSIIRLGGGEPAPPYANLATIASSEAVARAVRLLDIILLENAHELLEYGAWRDPQVPIVISALINIAGLEKKKIVIETQRDLPLGLDDPAVRKRLRVNGLESSFAKALFDAQLRRVGLSPDTVRDDQRDVVAQKLGGHPVATAIAADAIYESGGDEVIAQLRKREGFFMNFLRSLISKLHLVDEEQTLLRLLCLARDYVPREVVTEAAGFDATRFMRNLSSLGTVESGVFGTIRIAPILREYFDPEELPKELANKFHRVATTVFASLSKQHGGQLSFAVESDYHGGLSGHGVAIVPNLIDSALAVAKNQFDAQKYDGAYAIVEKLLQREPRWYEGVRLGAQIQARRNKFQSALELAREAFAINRKDTWLLAELARIALTLSRDDVAEQLVGIAENAAVEDTSILIVQGRMALRRKQLDAAEQYFYRAKQLTERNAWPFFYLGRTYMQLGQMDDAIDVLFEGEAFIQENILRAPHVLNAIRTQLAYCYLFSDRIDLAEPIIMRLWNENRSAEVVRAYAALTIKKQGIDEAHQALKQLERAEIRSRYDRCQFHLLYGLFYLGINENTKASAEFEKAHKADRTNVFVMIKLARTLLDIAKELWIDRSDEHRQYVNDCAALVKQILRFDSDNQDGIDLMQELYRLFKVEIKTEQTA